MVEESVNALETKTTPFLALLLFAVLVYFWIGATMTSLGPVPLFETFGFSPVIVIFVVSYFAFFLGSKTIFRPTVEELKDDTSTFAVFSACKRREARGLISIALALVHTVIFLVYLIGKDPKLMELF